MTVWTTVVASSQRRRRRSCWSLPQQTAVAARITTVSGMDLPSKENGWLRSTKTFWLIDGMPKPSRVSVALPSTSNDSAPDELK